MTDSQSVFEGRGHELTRRRLLQVGAGCALVFAVGSLPTAEARPRCPAYLRRDVYEGLVGERFAAHAGGSRRIDLRLLEVSDFGRGMAPLRHVGRRDDAFTLLFHGLHAPRLPSAVHRLFHPRLGSFELLMSPSGAVRGGQDYSIVINRIRDTRILEAGT